MTNIHDIAKKSGVSASTVSRVLNGKNYVANSTSLAVEAAMKELNYVPNDIARDFSHGRNYNVGVILPHTKHPYFTQILSGIIAASFESDYRVVILPSQYNESVEIDYLEQLRRKAFDALIFISHEISLDKITEYSQYGRIVVSENPNREDVFAVYSKRRTTYLEAFKWLKSQQIEQVAVLLSRDYASSVTSQITLDAYQSIFTKLPNNDLLFETVTTFQDGYEAAQTIIKQQLNVQCIFTNGDDVAAGVVQAYKAHQKTPPLVIGQENQLSGQLLNIPTINHHFDKLGRQALELVTGAGEMQQVVIESDFIIR